MERQKNVNISFWQICSVKHVNRLKSTISFLSVDKYMRLEMYKHWGTRKAERTLKIKKLLAGVRCNALVNMDVVFIGMGHALMTWQHIWSNPNLRCMHWTQNASRTYVWLRCMQLSFNLLRTNLTRRVFKSVEVLPAVLKLGSTLSESLSTATPFCLDKNHKIHPPTNLPQKKN